MKIVPLRWTVRALGLLLLTVLYACLVPDGGYVGGVYEPSGYDYGGWGRGYQVGPPRGRAVERRPERLSPPRAYRPAPQSRPAPSIPERPRKH
jgi:hypothetical protein